MGSDVSSILDLDDSGLNIRSTDIEAVIWSHNHFDHIGDVSRFPHSTDLIVGPGVRAASWPGWPRNPDAIVLDCDAEGRLVREVLFNSGLKIGRFDAHDFFGDGSFYLLDAPGHSVGHMCGLARVTSASVSSFVLMGADACHHAGALRPSDYLPMPSGDDLRAALGYTPVRAVTSSARPLPAIGMPCPGDMLHSYLTSPSAPFFTVARGPLFPDHDAAMDTVRKIQELDAVEGVLVLMAHDLSLRDRIPIFPDTINDWRASGLKTETRWLFCNDFGGS